MADKKALLFTDQFLHFLGMYHGVLGSLELVLCCGITKLLKIPPESGHILTSGMELGRKLTLLRNVAHRSNHEAKNRIIQLLGKIQNESKRNVLAHSYITTDVDSVTFVERSRGGDYRVTRHRYTLKEFVAHIAEFMKAAAELETVLEITEDELHKFGEAAFSAATSATKSPTPPISSA
jgi:hypothetical protein